MSGPMVAVLPRDLLERVLLSSCDAHPDVAALVEWAAAPQDSFACLVKAAERGVAAALAGFDWDRRWKYAGAAASAPLERMLSLAGTVPTLEAGLAVGVAGIRALADLEVPDRYGDLTGVVERALACAYPYAECVPDELREALASSLVSLACATSHDGILMLLGAGGYDGPSARALLPGLVGERGRALVENALREFEESLRAAGVASPHPLVARTRAAQAADYEARAERCRELLAFVA